MGKGAPGSIDDLTAAEYNPRRIEDAAAGGLKASLEKFGDISGIVFNVRTGRLVSGHQRVNQLREMGAHFATDGHPRIIHMGKEYRVRVVDWDEVTERAANVTANNPHIGGEFTADLQPMLGDLEVELGDEFGELKLGELKVEIETAEVEEDDVPEPPTDPVTKPGDIWALGKHRVWCKDSIAHEWPKHDMVFTDPPYGVDHVGGDKNPTRKSYQSGSAVTNDAPEMFEAVVVPALDLLFASTKPGGAWYIAAPAGPALLGFIQWMMDRGTLRQALVWVKNAFVFGRSDYHYRHEMILYGWKDGAAHCAPSDRTQDSVWEFDRGEKSIPHPTSKPVGLVSKAIGNSSRKEDLICDPFLGSGTTLIAAEQLGRVCHGVEIEPKYVDVVIERWQNLTGEKAKRVSG